MLRQFFVVHIEDYCTHAVCTDHHKEKATETFPNFPSRHGVTSLDLALLRQMYAQVMTSPPCSEHKNGSNICISQNMQHTQANTKLLQFFLHA